MNGSPSSIVLVLLEPVLCLAAFLCVMRSKNSSEYRFFKLFLGYHLCSSLILLPLLLFGGHGIKATTAYQAYFYIYWINFTIETILSLLMIFSIFDLAMAPLEGIRKLGVLIFRWAASMSVAVTFGAVLVPHQSQAVFMTTLITQLQRGVGILTLGLLLFVCFAIRPLGLSHKSRIFGIASGLGILAVTKLVVFGWMATSKQLYSGAGVLDEIATCIAMIVWTSYFAAPECKRRIVVLPTTSPFLRWNQISMALGDAPGFVAVGGIPPELFSPAELEVMRRASLKMMGQSSARHDQTQPA